MFLISSSGETFKACCQAIDAYLIATLPVNLATTIIFLFLCPANIFHPESFGAR